MTTGKDRRRYVRLDREVKVRFSIGTVVPSSEFQGVTTNVSQSGICLEIRTDPDRVEQIIKSTGASTLTISLPEIPVSEGVPLPEWIACRVQWVIRQPLNQNCLQIGLDFWKPHEFFVKRVREYIEAELVKESSQIAVA